jgi:membrane-bound acyltransferase YfiQ involved in biofilm formation
MFQKLDLSKGPNRDGVSPPLPEDGNRSSFQNVVFSSFLEYQTMVIVQKLVISSVIHHHKNRLESTSWICMQIFLLTD